MSHDNEDGANLLARSTPIAFSVTWKYWVNNHAHILKFEDMATQRFVEFYLGSIKLDEYITGAAQPKLNQKMLNLIPIPIPKNVEAQAQIVESIELLSAKTETIANDGVSFGRSFCISGANNDHCWRFLFEKNLIKRFLSGKATIVAAYSLHLRAMLRGR
ncbi:MAG: restriction endonuclease subunit S [Desulfocapsaceae bacterium]|nr:restriction endonuclease subunit S [Desulfocapsaceae bacterium]